MARASLRLTLLTLLTLCSLLSAQLAFAEPALPQRRGALVMAKSDAALAPARALARAVYRDPGLRPNADEPTVRVALGGAVPESATDDQKEKLAGIAKVRQAALAASDADIATRLLSSLGQQLGVELIVLVEPGQDAHGAVARVLAVSEGRFLPMALSPKVAQAADRPPEYDWSDALPVLRGLAAPAPAPAATTVPGPKKTAPVPAPAPTSPPEKPKPKTDWKSTLIKSPWFWGGLGAVVAVGVTVLVLSQTALNQPDKVMLNGSIGQ